MKELTNREKKIHKANYGVCYANVGEWVQFNVQSRSVVTL